MASDSAWVPGQINDETYYYTYDMSNPIHRKIGKPYEVETAIEKPITDSSGFKST